MPDVSRAACRRITCFWITGVSLLFGAGCSSLPNPSTRAADCLRAPLDPPPLWTASAVWTGDETGLVVLDPKSRSLRIYDRSGRHVDDVLLDPLAEIDTASPVRLTAHDDGYLLSDQTQLLWLDESFTLKRRVEPFADPAALGLSEGSLNDVVVHDGALVGYLDVTDPLPSDADEAMASHDTTDDETDTDTDAVDVERPELWHRGFYRLDLETPRLVTLAELSLGGEFATYYDYHRRPYVTELGRRVYVLRFTDPPRLLRASRQSLVPVAELGGFADLEARSIYAWEGRLYVLATRSVEVEVPEGLADAEIADGDRQAMLRQMRALVPTENTWDLIEIDARSGRLLARYVLPSTAPRLYLVPGRTSWALIEESSSPNVGEGDAPSLLLLPSEVLRSRRSADGGKIAVSCAPS